MRTLLGMMWAATLAAQVQAPSLLLNNDDIARINALSQREAWAAAVRTSILQTAKSWPAPHNAKYGLAEWSVPPEGGQWTHWYVCPVHGTGLQFRAPNQHICTVDNRSWADPKFDQVIYSWRNSDNAGAARDLALAYAMTGDIEYARSAAQILLAYAEVYSAWPIHDTNGRIDARSGGRMSAQTLDEAVWLIPIAWAYDLIAASGVLDTAQREKIEQDLLQAAVTVIQRNDAGASNWQSWHNGAIGAVGFATGKDDLVRQAVDGKSGFRFQMKQSVFDDGFWYEGAWSYHFYALDPLWTLAEMGLRHGIDLYGELPLRKMFEAPLRFALPDWTLPAFNDSGAVNVLGSSRFYEIAYARYNDPLFASVLGRSRGREALFWGVETLPDNAGPPRQSDLFPASGYAVLRNPDSDHTIILDFGPHGGGHGHYDKLGFVSYARGTTMAVDPGTQPYAAPTHSTWDKMTIAHNTVSVDEKAQREAQGKLLAFATSGVMTAVRADAGPAYAGVSLERTIYLAPEYAVDVFNVRSTDGADHTFDWAYHNFGTLETSPAMTPFSGFGKSNGYQHLTKTQALETAGDWEVRFDGNKGLEGNAGSVYASVAGIRATFTYSREQAASGLFSGKIGYDFGQVSGYTVSATPQVSNQPNEMPRRLVMMIYGDGSGNRFTVRLHDASDERFVKTVGPVNWTGWKEITVDAPETWGHWGGNEDGLFDLPARAAAIELAAEQGGAVKGTLYVDDIALDYAQAGRVVIADFERPLRAMRMWMLGAYGTTAVTGEGLGPDLRVPVPFALARRRGREARFVTLLEPYGERTVVKQFRELEDGSIEVTGAGFQDVMALDVSGVLRFERRR